MAYCSATLKYNIPNSDDTPNWRTAECGKIKSDDGYSHADGDSQHVDSNRGKTWSGPMDSESTE